MIINLNKQSRFGICLFVIAALSISSGCRTGMFKKPDMSKLAFWKKDKTDSTMPPPPARHFDPAPINGMQEAIASSEKTLDVNQSEFARRIENRLENHLSETQELAQNKTKPIRDRYALSDSEKQALAQNKTPSFSDGFNTAKNKVASNEFVASASDGLTQAQKDFQSAIGGATAAVKDGFAATKSKTNDLSNGWKDFKLPTELSNKSNVDQSVASVNKSLYDASGKLNTAVAKQKNNFSNDFAGATTSFADASNAIQNQLTSATDNVAGLAKSGGNDFIASAQNKVNDFKATVPDFKKPVQDFGQTLSQGGEALAEKANNMMQPVASALGGVKNPLTPQSNSISPTSSPELQSVQDQVAAAKKQIEMLKQQVAEAQRLASAQAAKIQNSAPAQTQLSPVNTFQQQASNQTQAPQIPAPRRADTGQQPVAPQARVAQLQVPRFQPQAREMDPANLQNAPMNTLRATTPIQNGISQPALPAQQNNSGFQSTPHGGFSPRASLQGTLNNFAPSGTPDSKQVNFETQPASGSSVSNASVPSSSYIQPKNKSGLYNSVQEVDIPASVLQGSGSYAPGSVHPLNSK